MSTHPVNATKSRGDRPYARRSRQRPFLALAAAVVLGCAGVAAQPGDAPAASAAGQVAAQDGHPQEFAYVADGDAEDVTVVETAGRSTVTGKVKVGSHPVATAITPDGKRAYVANSGSDTVSVIDTTSHDVTTIKVGDHPSAVAISLDGSRAYVANTGSGTVSVIDNDDHPDVAATLDVGLKPEGVAISADGSLAYVANTKSGTVSMIKNDGHPNVIHNVRVGKDPVGVAVTVDGSRAYVANSGSDTLSVLNTATRESTTVKVGKDPTGVAVNVDGSRAYAANSGSDTVTVLNTATRNSTIVKVGKKPTSVAVTVDGTRALVANAGSDTVSVLDAATGAVEQTVGDAGPHPVGVATGAFRHSVIISIGDSFISGVAGRWRGNAAGGNTKGSNWGTDRAVFDCRYQGAKCEHDTARVYGPTAGGCLQSDSAEVLNADVDVERRLNLACSGAETRNVDPGGEWWKGEAPQGDQLRFAARHERVKMIVVDIGGNDLGFRGIIKTCITSFLLARTHCNVSQKGPLAENLNKAEPKVSATVKKLQQVMADSGYDSGDYRLVLQTYPNPVAPAKSNRYPERGYTRHNDGGCPIYNDDSDWVAGTVVPDIASMLERVARDRDVELLDVSELFRAHEVCSKGAEQATERLKATSTDFGAVSEWARFLDLLSGQGGILDETVHPNYFGQQALGSCLRAVYRTSGNAPVHTCTARPGTGPGYVEMVNTGRH